MPSIGVVCQTCSEGIVAWPAWLDSGRARALFLWAVRSCLLGVALAIAWRKATWPSLAFIFLATALCLGVFLREHRGQYRLFVVVAAAVFLIVGLQGINRLFADDDESFYLGLAVVVLLLAGIAEVLGRHWPNQSLGDAVWLIMGGLVVAATGAMVWLAISGVEPRSAPLGAMSASVLVLAVSSIALSLVVVGAISGLRRPLKARRIRISAWQLDVPTRPIPLPGKSDWSTVPVVGAILQAIESTVRGLVRTLASTVFGAERAVRMAVNGVLRSLASALSFVLTGFVAIVTRVGLVILSIWSEILHVLWLYGVSLMRFATHLGATAVALMLLAVLATNLALRGTVYVWGGGFDQVGVRIALDGAGVIAACVIVVGALSREGMRRAAVSAQGATPQLFISSGIWLAMALLLTWYPGHPYGRGPSSWPLDLPLLPTIYWGPFTVIVAVAWMLAFVVFVALAIRSRPVASAQPVLGDNPSDPPTSPTAFVAGGRPRGSAFSVVLPVFLALVVLMPVFVPPATFSAARKWERSQVDAIGKQVDKFVRDIDTTLQRTVDDLSTRLNELIP